MAQNFCKQGNNMITDFCFNYPGRFVDRSPGWGEIFTSYCERQGVTVEKLARSGALDDRTQAICLCNLPLSEYIKLENALRQQYPALSGVSLGNPRCLFPGCAASVFKDESLLNEGCTGIQCINAISITGAGDIGKIQQSAECANIAKPTPTAKPQAAAVKWGLIVAGIVVGLALLLGVGYLVVHRKPIVPAAGTISSPVAGSAIPGADGYRFVGYGF
jgi:hypothetical protein